METGGNSEGECVMNSGRLLGQWLSGWLAASLAESSAGKSLETADVVCVFEHYLFLLLTVT